MLSVPCRSRHVGSLPRINSFADTAPGLFSKAVWALEINAWNKIIGGDAAEVGSGPGSYDVHKSVWHVNCCNAEINGGGGWGIFNALFGWENSATYGSVLSYNLYWLTIIVVFASMRYKEKHGHWPLLKAKPGADDEAAESDDNSREGEGVTFEMKAVGEQGPSTMTIQEIGA